MADENGEEILLEFNPDFGYITQINFHRVEVYGTIFIFIFLDEYYTFYRITLRSLIQYYCDKKEVIKKLRKITEYDQFYYLTNSKIKDLDAVLELQKCIPKKLIVNHVSGNQDRKKRNNQCTMVETLIIQTNMIIWKMYIFQSPLTSVTLQWQCISTIPTTSQIISE